MQNKTTDEIAQHVKILGWLYIALSVATFLLGALVTFIVAAATAVADDPEASLAVVIVGAIMAVMVLIFALPGVVTGAGLLKRKSWGRILAIIMSVINLMNFPLGTAVGVYALWVLLPQETAAYFAGEKTI